MSIFMDHVSQLPLLSTANHENFRVRKIAILSGESTFGKKTPQKVIYYIRLIKDSKLHYGLLSWILYKAV